MTQCKALLVYVEDNTASDFRIAVACDLADRFDACVIGISASEPAPPLYDPMTGLGDVLTTLHDAAEEDVRRARSRFEAVVTGRGNRFEWRGGVGTPAAWVAREARCADLVVIGPQTRLTPYRSPDPADVLMAIGRPMLIVPEAYEGSCLDGVALVAWKETREAQRAVAAALPFLREAIAVDVVEISGSRDAENAALRVEDIAHFLARHDVKAEARAVVDHERMTSDRIRSEAAALQANLIVFGAYGHARLREWALGGVTRELFAHCDVCLLVAH